MTMNRTSRTALALVGTVGIALALTACGASTPDSSSAPVATATPAVDYVGQNACDTYRVLVGDLQKNLVAGTEIRGRIQKIYDDGQYAKTESVMKASIALLAADTAGDATGSGKAAKQLDKACSSIGH